MDPIVAQLAVTGVSPDGADGAIVAGAIVVTELVKRIVPAPVYARLKPVLPILVLLTAVAFRAAYDSLRADGALTLDTVWRAVAAGGVAVWTHAQARSLFKVPPVETTPPPDEGSGSGDGA